ncbi:hypothetical protein ACFP63_16465 [Oerskovia jenensis]|uniref:DUF559 domain-containing protein n=1 Tax=Oerskovia jenensis TaxID=162169 RepID=A0ABS2LE75_9CELL|nr:hypothetical protein [Oerskovia jenensis]MBM7478723.1 hypothetical protein [Oerskovia jenensis]
MTGSSSALRTVSGLARLAARQAHAVTRKQLADLGVDRFHIGSQLSARRWQLVAPEVLVLYTGPLAPGTRLWVVALAAAEPVAIGSWTGLALHGLRGWDRPGIHVVVRRGSRPPRLAGVVVHESRRPAPEDIEHRRGLPVHRVERCAIDAAAWQTSPRTAVGLLAAVVQQRLTTPERLWEQLDRVGKVRFHRLMRASVADIRGGADALSEIDFGKLCREHGFPEPRRQVRRQDARGRWRFLDAEWDLPGGRRLVVEIDGIGHMEATRWYDDLLRGAELGPDEGTVTIRLPAAAARIEPLRVARILERYLRRT